MVYWSCYSLPVDENSILDIPQNQIHFNNITIDFILRKFTSGNVIASLTQIQYVAHPIGCSSAELRQMHTDVADPRPVTLRPDCNS